MYDPFPHPFSPPQRHWTLLRNSLFSLPHDPFPPLSWVRPISTQTCCHFLIFKKKSQKSPPPAVALEPTAAYNISQGTRQLPAAQPRGQFFLLILSGPHATQQLAPSSWKHCLPWVETPDSRFCCHVTSCYLDVLYQFIVI